MYIIGYMARLASYNHTIIGKIEAMACNARVQGRELVAGNIDMGVLQWKWDL